MITPPERLPERDAAIVATLPHVAFEGWTLRALRSGLTESGLSRDEADLLFPLGAIDMIETFCDLADRRMAEAATNLPEIRPSARLRAIIALRLDQNRPYKEAVRRGLAVLALPHNARASAQATARTIDAIWHAAGDRSTDFAWYTKRAVLTAIYTVTLLYWLRDTSDDDAPTLAFLDRMLASHARFRRLSGRADSLLAKLPLPRLRRVGDTG
jgi:ubiquinone biosynthesis protein COQ9